MRKRKEKSIIKKIRTKTKVFYQQTNNLKKQNKIIATQKSKITQKIQSNIKLNI